MNNAVYQEIYGNILNEAQRIRKEIMNEWSNMIMFGGSMPQNVMDELSIVARITGLAFDALNNHEVKIEQVENNPDLYKLNVRNEDYICHKTAIPSMVGFLDTVSTVNTKIETPKEIDKEEKKEDIYSLLGNKNENIEEELENEIEDESSITEEDIEETQKEMENLLNSNEEEIEEDDEEFEDDNDIIVEPKAKIIGSPSISTTSRENFFFEEREKNVDDIIYTMFDINLCHSGYSAGKPTEMQIMVAPLKISKYASTSVPILVTVYHKGKVTSMASYEQSEEGKNLLIMDIDEYYLLFRGTFTANGEFKAYVTTTGMSATQGDILTVTSEKHYGDVSRTSVNNGHIKIRALIDDLAGTIEAFPFGEPENEEFILLTKNEEFVEYFYMSNLGKGLKKTILHVDGSKKYVSCNWDDDTMKIEIKEG